MAKRQAHHKASHPQEVLTDIELSEVKAQLDLNLATDQLTQAKNALGSNNIELADNNLRKIQEDIDIQYESAEIPVAHSNSTSCTSRRSSNSQAKSSKHTSPAKTTVKSN